MDKPIAMLKVAPKDIPQDFYPVKQVYEEFKVSRRQTYHIIAQGKLPKPTRWHQHWVGWSAAEIIPVLETIYVRRIVK